MTDSRIEQFQKMAEADPDNELGHFSLGKAYMDVERYAEAVAPLARAIEINGQLSKAYALLGWCQIKLGNKAEATETLNKGFLVAHQRGDVKPRDEISALFSELGMDPPAVADTRQADRTADTSDGSFACRRCGRGPALESPPMKGELDARIHETVCVNCWREWLAMGTKVINELRLDFRSQAAQEAYDSHMKEFLGME